MTSVIVSIITVCEYQWTVEGLLTTSLIPSDSSVWEEPRFANKDIAVKLTDQENIAVAISSLVVIFSIMEIALAVCAAWISDSLFQPLQKNQISQVCEVKQLWGIREITIIPGHKRFGQLECKRSVAYSMVSAFLLSVARVSHRLCWSLYSLSVRNCN